MSTSSTATTEQAARLERAEAPAPSFHAYLDFKAIQRDPISLVENCRRRGASADPERVAALYGQFIELQQLADRVRADRNQNSAQMKVWVGGGALSHVQLMSPGESWRVRVV